MKASPNRWANKIVAHDVVPAEDLLANPDNWRIHPKNQQNVMEGVLDELGWIDEIKVSKHSGLVIDGHMRASIAISRNENVPVCYLDLTPEEEALALATYNPIASLAVPDEAALNEVLGKIDTPNPEIAAFLDGLYTEVNQGALKSAAEETGEESEGGSGGGAPKAKPTIRMLMQVNEINLLEQAIMRTGASTRGQAIVEICQVYLSQSIGGLNGQKQSKR